MLDAKMKDIQIKTKNEKDTLPICRKSREEQVNNYHLVEMIALEYFLAKKIKIEKINKRTGPYLS